MSIWPDPQTVLNNKPTGNSPSKQSGGSSLWPDPSKILNQTSQKPTPAPAAPTPTANMLTGANAKPATLNDYTSKVVTPPKNSPFKADPYMSGVNQGTAANFLPSLYEQSGLGSIKDVITGKGQYGSAFNFKGDNFFTELPGAAANTLTAPFKDIGAQLQNVFGGKGEINLDTFGLTPAKSYSKQVQEDVNSGTAPWLAVFKQVPSVIFDTLFVSGEARRPFESSEATITSGDKKASIPTNVVGNEQAPSYLPIDKTNPAGAEVHSALENGNYKKYDPAHPTFLKVTPTPEGFQGDIVQIKPSLAKRGYDALFGNNGKALDPQIINRAETVVDGGKISNKDVPQLDQTTDGAPAQAPSVREQLGMTEGAPKEAPIVPMHEQLGLENPGTVPAQIPGVREQLMASQAPAVDPQVQKYNDIIQKKYGTDAIISADDAKETYPDYNGTNSDKFQKLGSDFAMKRYQDLLNTRQGQGNNAVLFLTGGTGAGKTTALKRGVSNFKDYPIIYELNGQHLPGMKKVIQDALDKGFKVEQVHVHADPSVAYDRVINRVGEEGRVVNVDNHIQRHEGSYNNLPSIKKHFGDRIQQFGLVNNDIPTVSTIDKLPKYKYSEIKEQLHEKLNEAEQQGKLTPEQAAKSRAGSLGQQKSETNSSTSSERSGGSEQGVRSQSESLDETKKDTSITLQGGIPGVSEFIEQDIKPGTVAFVKGAIQTFKDARNLIAPRMGASRESLDTFMKMKGNRDKMEFIMQRTLKTADKMFDHLSQKEQIAFFDNYKTGKLQPSKELQAYADFRRDFDQMVYDEIKAVKPDAAWIEDHMRVLWKKIPGSAEGVKDQIFGSKKPLQGSKGFLKQHTLPDMTTGLEMGGVPYTYNPARIDNLAWSDSFRYISAQKMWKALLDSGSRQYLAPGKPVPIGKALVNDQIANIFFGGGRWVLDSGDARLLNNMLSTDYIRKSAAGRGALIAKNVYTAVELSLSAFHAIFVTADTMASRLSLGLLKIVNLGIKNGLAGVIHASPSEIKDSIKAFADGTKDIISTPTSFITTTRQGVAATRSLTGKPNIMKGKDLDTAKEEFKKTQLGKMLYQQYANYPELVDLLFDGGLKPKMDAAYRTNTIDSFTAAVKQGNYIGGALRAIPALSQTIMTPLFEWYIPALKWGVSMKALAYELEVNADRIANGKTSKEEVARNVVNRTENRLGEMGFDNLFWNNTLKTSMQILFRSVTWSVGSVREIGLAPFEQAREFYSAFKEKRAPNMTPKVGYIFALLFMTAAIAETIQYLSTGKHIDPLSKDIAYPRVNEYGDRVVVPTYIKDVLAFKQNPVQTIENKMSGLWGKLLEDLHNKDFYSNEIYSTDDPQWMKFTKAAWHLKPVPFSIQSEMSQDTTAGKIQSFAGITKAPRYIDNTPLQNEIYDAYNQRFSGGTKSALQTTKSDTSTKYKNLLKAGKLQEAMQVKQQAIKDGVYTEKGFGRIETNLSKGTDRVLFDRLPLDDKLRLIKKMSPDEKKYYLPKYFK